MNASCVHHCKERERERNRNALYTAPSFWRASFSAVSGTKKIKVAAVVALSPTLPLASPSLPPSAYKIVRRSTGLHGKIRKTKLHWCCYISLRRLRHVLDERQNQE